MRRPAAPFRDPRPPDRCAGGGAAGLLLAFALALAACGGAPASPDLAAAEAAASSATVSPGAADIVSSAGVPFDPRLSDRFLAEAEASAAAGDLAAAEQQYRAAAFVWPDNASAWQGLAAVADGRDDPRAAEAASFVLRRLYLFPSGALGVQREYRAALLGYVAEQEGAPDANPMTLTYARVLADYYAYRYRARGTHEPPEGYFDLRWADVPAAVVSAAFVLAYGGNIAIGASD